MAVHGLNQQVYELQDRQFVLRRVRHAKTVQFWVSNDRSMLSGRKNLDVSYLVVVDSDEEEERGVASVHDFVVAVLNEWTLFGLIVC